MENYQIGLSSKQVQERIDEGLVNGTSKSASKTYYQIFKENICSLSEVVDSDKFSNTIVWFKFRYINEQEEELMLRIGHSDPIRIWINEEPFIFVRSKYTPISYNDVVIYTNEKNIEVIIAIEISKGNANLQDRGIIVRVDSL